MIIRFTNEEEVVFGYLAVRQGCITYDEMHEALRDFARGKTVEGEIPEVHLISRAADYLRDYGCYVRFSALCTEVPTFDVRLTCNHRVQIWPSEDPEQRSVRSVLTKSFLLMPEGKSDRTAKITKDLKEAGWRYKG